MKILEKIDQALTGTKPAPKQNPIEVAAAVVCELAMPRNQIRNGQPIRPGEENQEDGRRIRHLLNFELTEVAANPAYVNQLEEHEAFITAGGRPGHRHTWPKPRSLAARSSSHAGSP